MAETIEELKGRFIVDDVTRLLPTKREIVRPRKPRRIYLSKRDAMDSLCGGRIEVALSVAFSVQVNADNLRTDLRDFCIQAYKIIEAPRQLNRDDALEVLRMIRKLAAAITQ
jgi:hypothetical protein